MREVTLGWFRHIARALIILLLTSVSVLITGCVYDPVYYGPPPHTHYVPHYYDYYFYPSARVYFHFTTGFYFYWVDGRWVKSRVLPPYINLTITDRVRIKVESDTPYTKYDEHVRIYQPRPDIRVDKDKSLKEREANKLWFQEYERKKEKPNKRPLKEKKEKFNPGVR